MPGKRLTLTNAINPSGTITMFGGASAPTGWVLCDGSAINRSTYADLFSAIGTTYGVGDGSTTFNVPDLRGIFPRGAGSNGTLTDANGSAFSAVLGTYQNDQAQGHIHTANVNNSAAATASPATNYPGNSGSSIYASSYDNTFASDFINAPSTDGTNGTPRAGVETRPANVGVNFIIKT